MLIDCIECGHRISDAAISCPSCGHPAIARGMTTPAKVAGAKRPAKPASKPEAVWAIAFLVGLLGLMVLVNSHREGSAPDAQQHDQAARAIADALSKGREAVKARLRDPASANFIDELPGADAAGEAILCGRVNAKNGFGGFQGFQRFIWVLNRAAPNGKVVFERDLGAGVMDVLWKRSCPA